MRRVIHRELRRIWVKPRYIIILTLGIIFSFIFFTTLMDEGQPEKLPVAVVDMDGSYLSRRICHELAATQGVDVKAVYDNHTEARLAIQRGEIFAFYEIPSGTYNEVLQFHAPHFGLYTNTAYLLAGMLSYRQLATMGMLAAGAVQREVFRKKGYTEEALMGLIQPVEFDTHPIGNPWVNYKVYLMTIFIPAIIAFLALVHTTYLIGREWEEDTVRNWMRKAGGNPLKALLGKILPYTFHYSLLALVANLIMFGPMHFPLSGSWLLLMLFTVLLVFAAQCAAVFISGCIGDPQLSMGTTCVYGALCFSLAGFSFPVESMPQVLIAISNLYPIRHYYLAYRDIAIFGSGLEHCWPQLCALLCFGVALLVGTYMFNLHYRQYERRRAQ
mgnify:CR=1 FL=1